MAPASTTHSKPVNKKSKRAPAASPARSGSKLDNDKKEDIRRRKAINQRKYYEK
jgi:hypothetical protein